VIKRLETLGRLRRRRLPVRERIGALGSWPFWLCLVSGLTCVTVAMALPQVTTARIRTAGLDLVVLQDGSASMHVRDVAPDRWQRSMKFVRLLPESLRWKDDRMALALFAHIAAPQVRLTRDPNTVFFFLDHLDRESPFPLKDETTRDTNLELGIYWGTRLIDKDQEFNGKSPNVRAFVLISDGQVWSGEIKRAISLAQARDIPIFAVGVGTAAGGYIPEAPVDAAAPPSGSSVTQMSALHAELDRSSLMAIAAAGRGRYFDLDRQPDRQIATTIIDSARRRAGPRGVEPIAEDLYWPFLFAGACLIGLGVLFLRERGELWLESAGAGLALWILWSIVS
jgi:Ca-activated chloride channel family protein